MKKILWWVGWRPWIICIPAILFGLLLVEKNPIGAAFLGGILGLVIWLVGVKYVNDNWEEYLGVLFGETKKKARTMLDINLDDHSDIFWLEFSQGVSPMIKPSIEYKYVVLLCTKTYVAIFPDNIIDLRTKEYKPGNYTKELYYQHINSVDYYEAQFHIRTSSGEEIRYGSTSGDADKAVRTIRARLREVAETLNQKA